MSKKPWITPGKGITVSTSLSMCFVKGLPQVNAVIQISTYEGSYTYGSLTLFKEEIVPYARYMITTSQLEINKTL